MADKPYVLNKLENAVYHDGDTAKDFSGNTLEFGKQPDWNQTDTTALDYVKNKPTLDTDIVSGSTNAVTGGAIYTALAGKADTAVSCNWTIEKGDYENTTLGITASSWHTWYLGNRDIAPFDANSTILVTLSQSATDEQIEACKNAKFQFQLYSEGDSKLQYKITGDVPEVNMPFVLTKI